MQRCKHCIQAAASCRCRYNASSEVGSAHCQLNVFFNNLSRHCPTAVQGHAYTQENSVCELPSVSVSLSVHSVNPKLPPSLPCLSSLAHIHTRTHACTHTHKKLGWAHQPAHHACHASLQQAVHADPLLASANAHCTGVLLLLEHIQRSQAGAINKQVPSRAAAAKHE